MKHQLMREFGWALTYTALVLFVLFLGSAGPQFVYAMF